MTPFYAVLKQLFELVRGALLLQRDVQTNRENLTEMRRAFDDLHDRVAELTLRLQDERHEREKLALKLENTLMRFERRLPPGKGATER